MCVPEREGERRGREDAERRTGRERMCVRRRRGEERRGEERIGEDRSGEERYESWYLSCLL